MATCEFCGTQIGKEGRERVRCRLCRAGYEVRENKVGKVFYECFDDPPPEIYNYALVRKRLLEAANQVIPQPETTLSLVADIWVELTTYVKGDLYCPEVEIAQLRAERDELAAQWATFRCQERAQQGAQCLHPAGHDGDHLYREDTVAVWLLKRGPGEAEGEADEEADEELPNR